jgi:geranylgeranyl pyrophosphate synthase
MDFNKRIKKLRIKIDNSLKNLFKNCNPENLYQPMYYLLNSGGKRIRPLLLIFSCQAVGGKIYDCLDAAIAVELLHTFTLVHDDIMDHDCIRRGRPTVHIKWDEPTAILAGDGLVTLAFQSLIKTKHPELINVLQIFTRGLLSLCEGQILDKEFESRQTVSLESYIDMIEKKTARLIRVSCEIGAILGNGTPEERVAISQFANTLGQAFQIQDDLLDLMGDESIFGKPLGSDIIEKKKTYLTIHFLANASQELLDKFFVIWEKDEIRIRDVLEIRTLFKKSGTFQSTQRHIKKLISDGLSKLTKLNPSNSREDMKSFALQIQNRIS